MTRQKATAPMTRARFRSAGPSHGAYRWTRARTLAAPLPNPDGIPPLTRWASLSASSIPEGTARAGRNSRSGLQSWCNGVGSGPLRTRARRRRPGSGVVDGGHQLLQGVLGVSEEHGGLGVVEEFVVDAGEARSHGALEEDDVLGL